MKKEKTMLRLSLFLFLIITSSAFAKGGLPKLLPAEDVQVTASSNPYETNVSILLVKCSDHRLNDETDDFMNKRGALDKYEEISMEGGSIGIDNVLIPELKSSFLVQLDSLKKKHDIKMVILLDHEDCDMFKKVHSDKHTLSHETEVQLHSYHLQNVKQMILEKYPDMIVEMLLMSLDGTVQTIQD